MGEETDLLIRYKCGRSAVRNLWAKCRRLVAVSGRCKESITQLNFIDNNQMCQLDVPALISE